MRARLLSGAALLLSLSCASGAEQPAARQALPERLADERHGQRVERIADELYVMGGFDHASLTEDRGMHDAARWDPGSGAWVELPPMRTARAFAGSVVRGGAVYAVGDGIERFDPARGAWETLLEPGSTPRSHFDCALVGSTVVLVGGYPPPAGGLFAFDLDARRPVPVPDLPGFEPSDHFHVVAEHAGDLHVLGGLSGTTFEPSRAHWRLRGGAWQRLADAPEPIWKKFALVQPVGRELFVFLSDAKVGLCYDFASATWRRVAAPPELIVMPASYFERGRIQTLGGMLSGGSSATWSYDVASDAWTVAPPRDGSSSPR
jgi:hypothetical protein